MAPTFPFTRLPLVEVFAVEDTTAQLVWRRLPQGTVRAAVDGEEQVLGEGGRPGAAEIRNLAHDREHHVVVTLDHAVIATRTIRTEPALPGPEQFRVATISDLHMGQDGFGLVKPMRERPSPPELHPLRCARAALRDAVEWGARLLVIKGDITEDGRPEQWELFDELLADSPIPVMAIPGNHDTVGRPWSLDATEALRRRGLFTAPVQARDHAGARVVAVDTTVAGRSWGRIGPRRDDLLSALDVAGPVLMFMHHHLEVQPVPWFWPLGVQRHDGAPTMRRLLEVNPDLLVSSGHTHRNRIRRHGTGVVTEVGSTKDHPGVWAGYVLHDAGIRQTVRRVSDPSCLEWTDRTHAAVGGIWGRWSPGRLHDRALTHLWSQVPASPPRSTWPIRSRLVSR